MFPAATRYRAEVQFTIMTSCQARTPQAKQNKPGPLTSAQNKTVGAFFSCFSLQATRGRPVGQNMQWQFSLWNLNENLKHFYKQDRDLHYKYCMYKCIHTFKRLSQ
ncbi:hypothetical protein ATANTOWER_029861 [Ataeniobius toweri]|uniref:Uncharacterized protein n=1 Tax=Ataeniobius toweri TaxID=208326 RepID=A0ABU7C4Q5_9TELE|nr:hypothetical protein [Ataeniobius toweri]